MYSGLWCVSSDKIGLEHTRVEIMRGDIGTWIQLGKVLELPSVMVPERHRDATLYELLGQAKTEGFGPAFKGEVVDVNNFLYINKGN